ncbi:MAG TPA: hypothetical protein VM077_04200 [Candidatus Limnocylindrales bacterium]|nr:hypothetical protein [Candidatus Limnocylindrales bacterium]
MTALPINLSDGFSPVVKVGDEVAVGQVIASNIGPQDEIINIPNALGVGISHARKIIKKIPGEAVEIGDVIAIKKSLFGTNTEVLKSKVAGTVTRFERSTGNLVIKTTLSTSTQDIISPVDGIVGICDNKEIVINTDKNVVIGMLAQGDKGTGEIHVLQEDDSYHLNAKAIGKIAVSKNFTREMILKGVGIGVAGIIGVGIGEHDIEYLKDKKFQIPIIKINEESYDVLTQWAGKKVFINPETKSIIFLQI